MEQPDKVEFTFEDGIFIKQMLLTKTGTIVPQHSHKYDHVSLLAVGSVRVWCDEKFLGDLKAPMPIVIKAGCKHTFVSLEPNTLIYCIHNVQRTGVVDVLEEHQIGDRKCLGAM